MSQDVNEKEKKAGMKDKLKKAKASFVDKTNEVYKGLQDKKLKSKKKEDKKEESSSFTVPNNFENLNYELPVQYSLPKDEFERTMHNIEVGRSEERAQLMTLLIKKAIDEIKKSRELMKQQDKMDPNEYAKLLGEVVQSMQTIRDDISALNFQFSQPFGSGFQKAEVLSDNEAKPIAVNPQTFEKVKNVGQKATDLSGAELKEANKFINGDVLSEELSQDKSVASDNDLEKDVIKNFAKQINDANRIELSNIDVIQQTDTLKEEAKLKIEIPNNIKVEEPVVASEEPEVIVEAKESKINVTDNFMDSEKERLDHIGKENKEIDDSWYKTIKLQEEIEAKYQDLLNVEDLLSNPRRLSLVAANVESEATRLKFVKDNLEKEIKDLQTQIEIERPIFSQIKKPLMDDRTQIAFQEFTNQLAQMTDKELVAAKAEYNERFVRWYSYQAGVTPDEIVNKVNQNIELFNQRLMASDKSAEEKERLAKKKITTLPINFYEQDPDMLNVYFSSEPGAQFAALGIENEAKLRYRAKIEVIHEVKEQARIQEEKRLAEEKKIREAENFRKKLAMAHRMASGYDDMTTEEAIELYENLEKNPQQKKIFLQKTRDNLESLLEQKLIVQAVKSVDRNLIDEKLALEQEVLNSGMTEEEYYQANPTAKRQMRVLEKAIPERHLRGIEEPQLEEQEKLHQVDEVIAKHKAKSL